MFKGAVFVFLGACCFGILSTFVKLSIASHHYTIADITCIQAFLGMIVLWAIHLLTAQKQQSETAQAPVKETSAWKMMLAGISMGLCTYLYYLGVNLLPASIAIVLLMNYTWMCFLIEWVVFRKKPTPRQLLSVVLVLLGTVLAGGLLNDKLAVLNITGIIYVLFAALVYAVYLIASGRLGNDITPIKKSALFMTGSVIFLFLIILPKFIFDGSLFSVFGLWGLFFAVFGTIIPPVLFAIGIPKTGVGLGSIMTSAELPVAVLAASLLLHEQVTLVQWGGISVILAALILPNLKQSA